MKKTIFLIPVFVCLLFSPAAQNKQLLTIRFEHRFGNKKLHPEETYYLNNTDTLTVNRFKYYVSHLQLVNTAGKVFIPENEYYLVDMADEKSCSIQIQVPPGSYTGIRFMMGVDSIRNVSGVQTGSLDPLHGMFWTWNSGYIMAKLEGTASSSMIAGKRFTYHIGGFRQKNNTTRMIELKTEPLSKLLVIIADAAKWFEGMNIAKEPVCHSAGALAVRFADNYSKMFSIEPSK